MSESESNNDKSSPNEASTSAESDVRERLTLHVRKRLSGELQVVIKQESPSTSTGGSTSEEIIPRKKSKKSKKKNKNDSNNKSQKKMKIKEESSPVGSEEQGSTETPDGSDEATSRHQSPAIDTIDEAAAQAARESFINNAILNEILNEKKKALFESEEILEILRDKMKTISP